MLNPILAEAFHYDFYYPATLPTEITESELYAQAVREGWADWIETPLDFEAMKNGYVYDLSRDFGGDPAYWFDGKWVLSDGTEVSIDDEEQYIAYVGKGDYFARFCEGFLTHTKGEIAGQPYRLLPWMRKVCYTLFGWVHNKSKYRRFQTAYLAVPKKCGKALSNDTVIPTPGGWTTHGELKVGDKLFDRNGEVCEVIAVHPKCDIDLEVEFTNGEKVRCNKDHLWVTESLINTKIWGTGEQPTFEEGCSYCGKDVYAKGLCVTHYNRNRLNGSPTVLKKPRKGTQNRRNHGYYAEEPRSTEDIVRTLKNKQGALAHRVRMHDGIKLPDAELLIDPWLLGYWLGDGNSDTAKLTIGDQDIDQVKANLEIVGAYVTRNSNESISYTVDYIGNYEHNRVKQQLRELGLLDNKHIPLVYLRGSFRQRLALLQGLLDSDGTISKCGKSISFPQKSKKVMDGVCELLASLGIKYRLAHKRKVCCNNGKVCFAYEVQFHAFIEEHPVFRLSRKLERMRSRECLTMETGRSRHTHIKNIKGIDPVEGNCITVSSPDGTYLVGNTMLPTHNSSLLSVVSIFCMYAEGEPKAYVYSCACDRNQARIIYDEAAGYIKGSPELVDVIGIIDSRSRLVHEASGSFYAVLSADHHRNDGIDSYCTLIDEIHRHKNRKLYAVMRRAGRARRQKLLAVITTYGPSLSDGSIWAEVHNEAKAQMEGKRPNSWQSYAFIASAEPIPVILTAPAKAGDTRIEVVRLQQPVDTSTIEFDLSDFESVSQEFGVAVSDHKVSIDITAPAKRYQSFLEVAPLPRDLPIYSEATANLDWRTDHAIRRANVAVDQIFPLSEIRKDIEESRTPEAEAETRQLSLNIVSGSGRKWLSNAAWQGCSRLRVSPRNLIGRWCYGGFDGSFGCDLTAFSLAFPSWDRDVLLDNVSDPRIDLLTWAWLPDHNIEAREEIEQMPYRYHARQTYLIDGKGAVRITKGAVLNFFQICEDIIEICRMFEVRAIAYDPNYSQSVIPKLEEDGLTCVAHRTSKVAMSPQCKKYLEFVYNGWLAHGDNPMLDRAVEGAQTTPPDDQGNITLSKTKSVTRIDPLMASVMSVGFACAPPEDTSGAWGQGAGTGMWN